MKAEVRTKKTYKIELDEIEMSKLCEEITTIVGLYPIQNIRTLHDLRTVLEMLV